MRIETLLLAILELLFQTVNPLGFGPGQRVLLDAHNCYPEQGRWSDRIDRALRTGVPLAIEQDLAWYTDPSTGKSWSVLAHDKPYTGKEPTLETYFFNRIRPIVERALMEGDRANWPLITLNLDFKSEEPEHLRFVLAILKRYQSWLTTAPRGVEDRPMPLDVKPVLVLTGESDAQQRVFYDEVSPGQRLLVFGAAHAMQIPASIPLAYLSPEKLMPGRATNYRRWWNNPWSVVEQGGQTKAGPWTDADNQRLNALVSHAHRRGLWIRFYTLNGYGSGESSGWSADYNFGSREAVQLRWTAAVHAAVDFVATDQYEDFKSNERRANKRWHAANAVAE